MYFTLVVSFKPPRNLEVELSIAPFDTGGNQGSDRSSDLPQVTQLRIGVATSVPEHVVALSVDSSEELGYERKEGKHCKLSWRLRLEIGTP